MKMINIILYNLYKVGCVFPMVVLSILPQAEFVRKDHWKDASHFRIDVDEVYPVFIMSKWREASQTSIN